MGDNTVPRKIQDFKISTFPAKAMVEVMTYDVHFMSKTGKQIFQPKQPFLTAALHPASGKLLNYLS